MSAGAPSSTRARTSGKHGEELREAGALESLYDVVALPLAEGALLRERMALGGERVEHRAVDLAYDRFGQLVAQHLPVALRPPRLEELGHLERVVD